MLEFAGSLQTTRAALQPRSPVYVGCAEERGASIESFKDALPIVSASYAGLMAVIPRGLTSYPPPATGFNWLIGERS